MRSTVGFLRSSVLVIAAAGALTLSGVVVAEEPDAEVVVESTPTTLAHRSPYTSQRIYTITRKVSYADLDLASHAGVQELEARMRDTADAICAKLARLDAATDFDEFRCVKNALRDGRMQARAAIAQAQREARLARGGMR